MKLLGLKLFFLFAMVAIVCLACDLAYRRINHMAYVYPKHLWIDAPISDEYKIVTVGNSHAQSGITFANYKIRSLNLASVAQRFSLDLAVLKQHSRQIETGAIVIIPVTPISFAHRIADQNDSLQTNYYATVSPFLIPHLHLGNYIQTMVLPFTRSGYLLRSQYMHTIDERIAKENRNPLDFAPEAVVAPHPPNPGMPTKAIPTHEILLDEPDFSSIFIEPISNNLDFLYNKWYNTPEFSPKYFEGNRHDLEEIISYSLAQGWRPVMITIPISSNLRKTLLRDFMQKYLYDNVRQADTRGIPYFDFSDDLRIATNSSYYANGDHLNQRGAALFSYTLLQKLIEQKMLPKEVDGFDYHKQVQ